MCAGKCPSAGGNIGGRRYADLAAQDFDLYGWRWLSTPREAVRPRCLGAGHVPLASGQQLPEGFRISCLSCNDFTGAGGWCTLAHVNGNQHCQASSKTRGAAARATRRTAKCRRVT